MHYLSHSGELINYHMVGGSTLYMLLWALLWLALIALAVYMLTKWTRNEESKPEESPLEIAKRRFAKGEINEEEYRKITNALESDDA